jgi:hypothetical protein
MNHPTPAHNVPPYGINYNQAEVKPAAYLPNMGIKTNESDFLGSFSMPPQPVT